MKLRHYIFVFLVSQVLNYSNLLGQTYGDFAYIVTNNEVKLTSYEGFSGTISIPSQINGVPVTTLGAQLFRFSSASNIIIPVSIKNIEDLAFQNCTNLNTISIPSNVTNIGNNAFQECKKLKEISLPAGITKVSWAMFQYCNELEIVNLPSGVTRIYGFAFDNCPKLKNINIPNGVTRMDMSAFNGCSDLETIEIPFSLNVLEDNVFSNCPKLKYVYFQGNAPTRGSNIFFSSAPIIYYEAGATGWLSNFAGRPVLQKGTFRLFVNSDNIKGTVSSNPQGEFFNSGSQVSLTANPKNGFIFINWSGDFNSSSQSINIVVNTNVVVTANYTQDIQDNDGDGLSNYAEYATYNTNPNLKDSNSDGVEDGQAVLMGYDPKINFSNLVSYPPAGLYTTNQIYNLGMGNLVLQKNTNGTFTLDYDIEQSSDLLTWLPYQALSLPLSGLPTNKAFLRIKMKSPQSSSNAPVTSSPNPPSATPF